jgi:hypothetical protein
VLVDDLIKAHPLLYHAAHPDGLDSILAHGVLSTSALLDLFEISGSLRERIECNRRATTMKIAHPKLGEARIRDHGPLNLAKLSACKADRPERCAFQEHIAPKQA